MNSKMTDNSIIPEILIVDDVPANLVALRRILRDINAQIVEAASGNEALKLVSEHNFAMILLDVQMPQMSGYEVAEILRSGEDTRNIPIIFITANATTEENAVTGYNAGAVDYIIKPINKTILRSKVFVLLELYLKQEAFNNSNSNLELSNTSQNCSNLIQNQFIDDINKNINLLNNTELSEIQKQYVNELATSSGKFKKIIEDM